jgi:hypothetical protein
MMTIYRKSRSAIARWAGSYNLLLEPALRAMPKTVKHAQMLSSKTVFMGQQWRGVHFLFRVRQKNPAETGFKG